MSSEIATMITDRSHRQPSKRKLVFIRLPVMAGLILLAPFLLPFAFRARRSTAFDALLGRVREVWQTSASDAIALLRLRCWSATSTSTAGAGSCTDASWNWEDGPFVRSIEATWWFEKGVDSADSGATL
jgi:hypothetical protein